MFIESIITILRQPTAEAARAAVEQALDVLEPQYPRVAQLLRESEPDVLAYLTFPQDHWRAISSTYCNERVYSGVDSRAKFVEIFPSRASLLRLSTAVLQDQNDERQDGRKAFSQHSMQCLLLGDSGLVNLSPGSCRCRIHSSPRIPAQFTPHFEA